MSLWVLGRRWKSLHWNHVSQSSVFLWGIAVSFKALCLRKFDYRIWMDLDVPCVEEQLQGFQISSLKDEDLERNRVAAKVWSHLSQAKILMMVLAPSKRPGRLFLEWHWVMGLHCWAYYFGCWSDSKHKSHYGQQMVHRYISLFNTTCRQVWELARRFYLGWLSSWRSMMNSA